MKFGHLIFRKITKYVAASCQSLRLKCNKFDFCWGSAPDPAGRSLHCSPDFLAGFKGPTSKGGREKGEVWEWKGRGEGEVGNGTEWRKGRREGWGGAGRGRLLVLACEILDKTLIMS